LQKNADELSKKYAQSGYEIDFRDIKKYEDQKKKEAVQKNIFVYGFIFMSLLISAVNILNSISSNLLLKKREYATLKSIGATQFQIKKLVLLEGMLYGFIAAVVGSVSAILGVYIFLLTLDLL
jgi:putative ABC transport system permease protein